MKKHIQKNFYLKVVNWFNNLHADAKERARNLFKGGCNKLLKIRQEGCGYFGSLDTQKINELKMYNDVTTYNKINQLINPIEEKMEHRKIANDYKQTCKELFGIGEEEEERRGRHRRTPKKRGKNNNRRDPSIGWEGEDEELGNDYNTRIFNVEVNDNGENGKDNNNNEYMDENDDLDLGHEQLNEHNSWLNANQKRNLKRMRDQGHESVELHDQIHKYSKSTTNKQVKVKKYYYCKGILETAQRKPYENRSKFVSPRSIINTVF
ncbi:unnamed protein product [Meloidogyne enterolobii]|uniref:Uncharacterized protein n=1 Tax=Meloidogyne enterolobii TaxID=390850 RepID=A0ACB0Y8Y3_MELEN